MKNKALLQKPSYFLDNTLKAINKRRIGVKQESKLFKWKHFEGIIIMWLVRWYVRYLYRAIDKSGQTLDWMLSRKRNTKAAKRFFKKVLSNKHVKAPYFVNVDKNPAFVPD